MINVIDYWKQTGYDPDKDMDSMKTICFYTKTRHDLDKWCKLDEFEFPPGCGWEQPFFIKSLAEEIGAKVFFEIGTGRGTACYAVSLVPSVKKIVTVDIIPYEHRMDHAIGFKNEFVANKNLFKKIPFPEKSKIRFLGTYELSPAQAEIRGKVDLCFIDGNHTDYDVIMNDFTRCLDLVTEDGVIIFDDYHSKQFAVKTVVDDIIANHEIKSVEMYQTRNALFDDGTEPNDAMVVLRGVI
jgi:predicted O-methyltransferase YrrM